MEDNHIFTVEEEDRWIELYTEAVNEYVRTGRVKELDFFNIAVSIKLDLNYLNKEGRLMYTLWVILLGAMRSTYSNEYKYPTMQSFLTAYPEFAVEDDSERNNLWQSANWMAILFTMITARKNKGLVMQVIPKLIEGWEAKYVTGSGQTKCTARRVHIFEVEGNTKANHRGKLKSKLQEEAAVETIDHVEKKQKKRPTKSYLARPSTLTPFADSEYHSMLSDQFRKEPKLSTAQLTVSFDKGEQLHDDVLRARQALSGGFLTRDDSLGLGIIDFGKLPEGPEGMNRDYSWMEIPVGGGGGGTNVMGIVRDVSIGLDGLLNEISDVSGVELPPPIVGNVRVVSDAPLSEDAVSHMFSGY
jgi:hypothetical protein